MRLRLPGTTPLSSAAALLVLKVRRITLRFPLLQFPLSVLAGRP
ncbi:hypothetical protein ACIRU8_19565 [Streptomyces sp. NPDC101175]